MRKGVDYVKNENALDILKEIALMIIEPKVRVVSVRPKGTKLNLIRQMERDRLLGFFSPEVESERITFYSDDLISGINYYLKKMEIQGL